MALLEHFTIDVWLIVGLVGQALFFSRMMVQWLYSEKYKKSMVPPVYWYLSLVGSVIIIVYGLVRGDLVIFGGQIVALFIYMRNIYLIKSPVRKSGTSNE